MKIKAKVKGKTDTFDLGLVSGAIFYQKWKTENQKTEKPAYADQHRVSQLKYEAESVS